MIVILLQAGSEATEVINARVQISRDDEFGPVTGPRSL